MAVDGHAQRVAPHRQWVSSGCALVSHWFGRSCFICPRHRMTLTVPPPQAPVIQPFQWTALAHTHTVLVLAFKITCAIFFTVLT